MAYYEITCIPELGKFSVGTRTLRGAAVSPNVERAVEIADRYGLIDSRMLRAGHEEPIRCDLGAELLEGTLEGPGPGSVTSASLTLSMNGQLWLDRLSFGIGSTAAITSVGRRRGFPTFGLSGWRHESDPCFARGRSYASKFYRFGYRDFAPLRDFDETREQMVATRQDTLC